MYYQTHIFICTNQRLNGKPCCQDHQAQDMCHYLKEKIKTLNLSGKGKIRVSAAGCLGRCAEGPILVIYPQQIWYTYQTKTDIDEIIEQHLLHDKIVSRLLLLD